MATQTAADLAAQIITNDASTVSITKYKGINATYDSFYCTVVRGGSVKPGKSCWCRTTVANSLSDQADEIIAALKTVGNVDANLSSA